jgi:hypothetical protein
MKKSELLKAAYLGTDRYYPESALDKFLKENGFQSPPIPSERLAKALMVFIQLEKSAKFYPNCIHKKNRNE